ncbi:hypothetical protein [Flavobacterium sp. H122]|nr:hypothetical protein [Flavobacterium sp. H122]
MKTEKASVNTLGNGSNPVMIFLSSLGLGYSLVNYFITGESSVIPLL